jgi:hypothetical protein
MSKIHNQEPTGSYNDGHRQAPAVKYQPKAQRSYFDVGIGSICLSGADTWGKYCLIAGSPVGLQSAAKSRPLRANAAEALLGVAYFYLGSPGRGAVRHNS